MPYKNLEQRKEYQKEHYFKNKNKILENAKENYLKNKDKFITKQKEYAIKNKDKIKEYHKEYNFKNKNKIKENNLKHKYGLTLDQYNKMLNDQNGCCKCCGIKFNINITPVVDHCHTTGKVRSLLCNNDNVILGLANENTARLTKLIKYIKEHNE